MNRRKFLKISALFCAPAIVKADNIMKVVAPPSNIIFNTDFVLLDPEDFRRKIIQPAVVQLVTQIDQFTIAGVLPEDSEDLALFESEDLALFEIVRDAGRLMDKYGPK